MMWSLKVKEEHTTAGTATNDDAIILSLFSPWDTTDLVTQELDLLC